MSTETYTAIRTVGGLLPADLLNRVSLGLGGRTEAVKDLEGLTSDAYHLGGERVRDAANRSWSTLVGAWARFQEGLDKLPESDPATAHTRKTFLLRLFDQLGYGQLDTTPVGGLVAGDKSFPVSHVWRSVPVHLLGWNVPIDKRTAGMKGAANAAPTSLAQELLNRSDAHLWAIVSNGRVLRLLRDSTSLVRASYVEFDLEAIFGGDLYNEFVLLYAVLHQSRFEVLTEDGGPANCWLETWRTQSIERGQRALDQLKDGVVEAINVLGTGFVRHPANAELRERLRSGSLKAEDYQRSLLRVVYRLLFLFVAEDRGALLLPDAAEEAKQRYGKYFSSARLREAAIRRLGTRHGDRWQALQLVLGALGGPVIDDHGEFVDESVSGMPQLGLPGLGGIFQRGPLDRPLGDVQLANQELLAAVRSLCVLRGTGGGPRRTVDYRNLDAEELGSVYETLLAYMPRHDPDARTFHLEILGGNERKTTGSYYTPSSLVDFLLDSALEPVLSRAIEGRGTVDEKKSALLAVTVCDPACGSGHFLVAAARRIAKRLAIIETGDAEPSADDVRRAVNKVIALCIYGVDINDWAVELAKVSLWMESLEPGKPLAFLDAHIKVGNSLLGVTPRMLLGRLPNEAFKLIDGDDRKVVSELRRRNAYERIGKDDLFSGVGAVDFSGMPVDNEEFAAMTEDIVTSSASDLASVHVQAVRYSQYSKSPLFHSRLIQANAWCAAFMWRKVDSSPPPVTDRTVFDLIENPESISRETVHEIDRIASRYRFFHWHLEFPEIFQVKVNSVDLKESDSGWSGGFSCILGNPPWETLSPDRKEFFAGYDPGVRFLKKTDQDRVIDALLENPAVSSRWTDYQRQLYSSVHYMKSSGRYRLFAPGNLGKGDFNAYRMFVETALLISMPGAYVSQVLPGGFYSGTNSMAIRKELYERWSLKLVLGLINSQEYWFNGVDSTTRFSVYVAENEGRTDSFEAAFNIRTRADLARVRSGGATRVSVAEVYAQSAEALAIPEVGNAADAALARRLFGSWPSFGDKDAGAPVRHYQREIDMGTNRDLFGEFESGIPLYEGRMIGQFDHRAKAYRSGRGRAAEWEDLAFGNPDKKISPQWRVPVENIPNKVGERVEFYRIGWCDVTSPRNERSLLAALVPPGVICGHSVPTFIFPSGYEWAYMPWLAVANSFCVDYIARRMISLHMQMTVLDSLPFPRLPIDSPVMQRLGRLALGLTCTSLDMNDYWNMMAQYGWCEKIEIEGVLPGWENSDIRSAARAEIDAIVAYDLFNISRGELSLILDSFVVLERRERKAYGGYKTKEMVLDAYDRIRGARESGYSYQSFLD